MTYIRPFKPNYGDGSDGSPASSSFTVAKQEYQWVNYTLDNGHTITLTAETAAVFRCQGVLTINGAVNGDQKGYAGGIGGYRVDDNNHADGYSGSGPGAGYQGRNGWGEWAHPSAGQSATHATTYSSLGELFKASPAWNSLLGSGGGGGDYYMPTDGSRGGDGGRGGGALWIIARHVVFGATASLSFAGQAGASGTNGGSSGGHGSPGGCIVVAETIELLGSGTIISATNNSIDGEIVLCYLKSLSGDPAARCSPAATVIDLKRLPILLG